MKKYQIPTLNPQTPKADQSKIVSAIENISGVSKAVLHLGSHEIEVSGRDQNEPKREDVASAASKIGFPLAAK